MQETQCFRNSLISIVFCAFRTALGHGMSQNKRLHRRVGRILGSITLSLFSGIFVEVTDNDSVTGSLLCLLRVDELPFLISAKAFHFYQIIF